MSWGHTVKMIVGVRGTVDGGSAKEQAYESPGATAGFDTGYSRLSRGCIRCLELVTSCMNIRVDVAFKRFRK